MEFITTENGRHIIQFENGMLIFSRITADAEKGYKYICYSGTDTTTTCVSSSRAKYKRYAKHTENIAFTVRVADFRRNDDKPFKKNVISKISLAFLRKLIIDNSENGYLSYGKLGEIAKAINGNSDTDTWEDDPTIDDNWDDDEVIPKKKLKKAISNGKKRKLKIKQKVSLKRVVRKKPLKKSK